MRIRPDSWAFLAITCGLCAVFGLGCESRVSLGGRCTSDPECGALRCLYGRCRAQCVTATDCGGSLECNDGVCAERTEACSASEPCTDPAQACAGTICAVRCTAEGTCDPSSRCAPRVGGLVCVPLARDDAGMDDAGTDEAGMGDAGMDDAGPTELDAARDAPALTGDASVEACLHGGHAPGALRDFCVARYHVCIVRADGTVACWGGGTGGELGGGEPLLAPSPPCALGANESTDVVSLALVDVVDDGGVPLADVVELECGERSTLARTGDGALYSWGYGSSGQLGRAFSGAFAFDAAAGRVTDRSGVPLEGVIGAATGPRHGCARLDTRTLCWGADVSDMVPNPQLGTGVSMTPFSPGALEATELGATDALAMTDAATCAVTRSGSVRCVGRNDVGDLGVDQPSDTWIVSASTITGLTASRVVAGSASFCALRGSDALCWGEGSQGALGRGELAGGECPDPGLICDEVPELVSGGLVFDELASGAQSSFVCGVAGGRAYCWGSSTQAGAGSLDRLYEPAAVLRGPSTPLTNVQHVRVGGDTACASTLDEGLYCWGSNRFGQLRAVPDGEAHPVAARVSLE